MEKKRGGRTDFEYIGIAAVLYLGVWYLTFGRYGSRTSPRTVDQSYGNGPEGIQDANTYGSVPLPDLPTVNTLHNGEGLYGYFRQFWDSTKNPKHDPYHI